MGIGGSLFKIGFPALHSVLASFSIYFFFPEILRPVTNYILSKNNKPGTLCGESYLDLINNALPTPTIRKNALFNSK